MSRLYNIFNKLAVKETIYTGTAVKVERMGNIMRAYTTAVATKSEMDNLGSHIPDALKPSSTIWGVGVARTSSVYTARLCRMSTAGVVGYSDQSGSTLTWDYGTFDFTWFV